MICCNVTKKYDSEAQPIKGKEDKEFFCSQIREEICESNSAISVRLRAFTPIDDEMAMTNFLFRTKIYTGIIVGRTTG